MHLCRGLLGLLLWQEGGAGWQKRGVCDPLAKQRTRRTRCRACPAACPPLRILPPPAAPCRHRVNPVQRGLRRPMPCSAFLLQPSPPKTSQPSTHLALRLGLFGGRPRLLGRRRLLARRAQLVAGLDLQKRGRSGMGALSGGMAACSACGQDRVGRPRRGGERRATAGGGREAAMQAPTHTGMQRAGQRAHTRMQRQVQAAGHVRWGGYMEEMARALP